MSKLMDEGTKTDGRMRIRNYFATFSELRFLCRLHFTDVLIFVKRLIHNAPDCQNP